MLENNSLIQSHVDWLHRHLPDVMERGASAEVNDDGGITVVTQEDIQKKKELLEEMGYDWLGHQTMQTNEEMSILEEARTILGRNRFGDNPPHA